MATDPWSPPSGDGGDHLFSGGPSSEREPSTSSRVSPDVSQTRWGIPDAIATLVLTMVIALGAVGALALLHRELGVPRPSGTVLVLVGAVLPWMGLLGIPLLVSFRKGNGPVRDYGLHINASIVRAGVAAGFVAIVAASTIGIAQMSLTGERFTSTAGEVAKKLSQDPLAVITLAIVAAVGAPIVEEIAMRGLLYGALVKRGISEKFTVVITAFVFAAYHLEPARLPLLFATGLVLGEVRRRTGSTSAAIVAHGVNNSLAAVGLLSLL